MQSMLNEEITEKYLTTCEDDRSGDHYKLHCSYVCAAAESYVQLSLWNDIG